MTIRIAPRGFCPVSSDLNDYLSLPEAVDPETERARCRCGRYFAREVAPEAPYIVATRCPECERLMGRIGL